MAKSRLSRVWMTGPLAPFADVYRLELERRRYTPLTTVNQLRQVARLSRWLEASGLSVAELTIGRVDEFLAFQRAHGCHRAGWSRPVPLHATVTEALDRYAAERERLCPRPRSNAFFLSSTGTALNRTSVAKTLRQITIGMATCTPTIRPRVHDLRHSFAVRTLIEWQRSGISARETGGNDASWTRAAPTCRPATSARRCGGARP